MPSINASPRALLSTAVCLMSLGAFALAKNSRRGDDLWYLEQSVPWPPQPYAFGYEVRDHQGNEQYRKEASDGRRVTGSYGYWGPDGIYRHVDYIADENGYRANIRTSEPGTSNENPASTRISSMPVSNPLALPPPRGPLPPGPGLGASTPPVPPPASYIARYPSLPPGSTTFTSAVGSGGGGGRRRKTHGGRRGGNSNTNYDFGRKSTTDFKRRSDSNNPSTASLPGAPGPGTKTTSSSGGSTTRDRDATYNPSRKGEAPSTKSSSTPPKPVAVGRSKGAEDKSYKGSKDDSQVRQVPLRVILAEKLKAQNPNVKVFITAGPYQATTKDHRQEKGEQSKTTTREMHFARSDLMKTKVLKHAYGESFGGQRLPTTPSDVTFTTGLYEVPVPPSISSDARESSSEQRLEKLPMADARDYKLPPGVPSLSSYPQADTGSSSTSSATSPSVPSSKFSFSLPFSTTTAKAAKTPSDERQASSLAEYQEKNAKSYRTRSSLPTVSTASFNPGDQYTSTSTAAPTPANQNLKFDDDGETTINSGDNNHRQTRQDVYYHPLPYSNHQTRSSATKAATGSGHFGHSDELSNDLKSIYPPAKLPSTPSSQSYSVIYPKPISYQYSHHIINLRPRKIITQTTSHLQKAEQREQESKPFEETFLNNVQNQNSVQNLEHPQQQEGSSESIENLSSTTASSADWTDNESNSNGGAYNLDRQLEQFGDIRRSATAITSRFGQSSPSSSLPATTVSGEPSLTTTTTSTEVPTSSSLAPALATVLTTETTTATPTLASPTPLTEATEAATPSSTEESATSEDDSSSFYSEEGNDNHNANGEENSEDQEFGPNDWLGYYQQNSQIEHGESGMQEDINAWSE